MNLNEQLLTIQGPQCIVPDCDRPWTDKAHIEPSGIGGRPSLRTLSNLVGMCHECHMIFDGQALHGRQRLLRVLMRHLADCTRLPLGGSEQ